MTIFKESRCPDCLKRARTLSQVLDLEQYKRCYDCFCAGEKRAAGQSVPSDAPPPQARGAA